MRTTKITNFNLAIRLVCVAVFMLAVTPEPARAAGTCGTGITPDGAANLASQLHPLASMHYYRIGNLKFVYASEGSDDERAR
jgi:hypothetical protein